MRLMPSGTSANERILCINLHRFDEHFTVSFIAICAKEAIDKAQLRMKWARDAMEKAKK